MAATATQFIEPTKLLDSTDQRLNDLSINNQNNEDYQVTEGDDDEDFFEVAQLEKQVLAREEDKQSNSEPIKCSAVHTLERDMPDFDYSHLVAELRDRILNECKENEGIYSQADAEKCKRDDWFLSRFLLRQKLDVDQAFIMLKKAMRFNNESLINSIRREDFPAEIYQVGGMFDYERDRKGNVMLYIRVSHHRKVPEIQSVLHAFIYYNIQRCDSLANGKGITIVFDCSNGGLANADMDTLYCLASTLVNYFPKGLSYLLVHEIPWILKPFWHIAKAWIPEEYRQLIKFSNSRTIYEYVDKENLPDFMGGTCKRDYRAVPKNCTTLEEAAKLWGIEARIAKRILMKFADYLPAETLEKANKLCSATADADASLTEENDSDQENRPTSDSL